MESHTSQYPTKISSSLPPPRPTSTLPWPSSSSTSSSSSARHTAMEKSHRMTSRRNSASSTKYSIRSWTMDVHSLPTPPYSKIISRREASMINFSRISRNSSNSPHKQQVLPHGVLKVSSTKRMRSILM